jgi:hypothetical protein
MRKALVCGLVLYTILNCAWAAHAAEPFSQGGLAEISSPEGNTVVRATVPIVGTAVDPAFWKYEVYYAPEPNPSDQWTLIGSVHEQQVVGGLLETWDTTIIPDGTYTLRLRVVNRTGNYLEVFARGIAIANAEPTETPIPTQTPLPTATATPAATPTFVIPMSPLAQPTATPTLARPTRSALPEGIDVGAWRQSICLGAQLMAVISVLIAMVFVFRRLL